MKNNEEKMIIVEIKPNDGTVCPLLDISNEMAPVCSLNNRVPHCKECRKGFSRAEAVEIMAKAICKISCNCKYYVCGNCTEYLEHYTTDIAEAALDAILGKEAEYDRN